MFVLNIGIGVLETKTFEQTTVSTLPTLPKILATKYQIIMATTFQFTTKCKIDCGYISIKPQKSK